MTARVLLREPLSEPLVAATPIGIARSRGFGLLVLAAALFWPCTSHADGVAISPQDRAEAISGAREWLRSIGRGDIEGTLRRSALPFKLVIDSPYLGQGVLPGVSERVRTKSELRRSLRALSRSTVLEDAGSFTRPSRNVRVRVVAGRNGGRVVHFEHDSNRLADGTYFDARVDVVSASRGTVSVVGVAFVGFTLR